ncbi:MAG: hypothetical protein D6693_08930 [Planctomycetota bacterium]|nr:MAG: hypothetical protein D6693_08930 [Planctomycetota bacterium]
MALIERDAVPLWPLVRLCHHRWGPAVVAALWETRGAKFVTLSRRLGVSPESLSRTLSGLDQLGLVMRNPGYGHPMRPEYLLAPDGETAGPAVRDLVQRVGRLGLEDALGRKWSVPVLAAAGLGAARFGDYRGLLPGVTARALSQALRTLESADLVERCVVDDSPPRSEHRLVRRGRGLASSAVRAAEALALILED